jgi:tripartite-type tricarboxylate transporter receptor subunit TctC
MQRLRLVFYAALLSLAAGAVFPPGLTRVLAESDKYPSKPVKILVPYGPGGATDIVARILADQLSRSIGQSFFVENKPGAFGIIAVEEMAHSPPDGYTLQIGNVSTNAITPIIFADKMKIDYLKDVVPVTNTVDIPALLVATTKNFDVKSVPELIAARLPEFPDLPTMQEIGYPDVGTVAWQGLFAPAGTPKEILQTIFDATVAAMKTPEAMERFKAQGFNTVPNSSLADAKTWLAQQMDTWRKITSAVKIETE